MQPAQQHGRRLPTISSVTVLSMWFALVSCLLLVMVQQIHSLRASGVRSCHLSRADSSALRAFSKSFGTVWTTPFAIFVFVIILFYTFARNGNKRFVRFLYSLYCSLVPHLLSAAFSSGGSPVTYRSNINIVTGLISPIAL